MNIIVVDDMATPETKALASMEYSGMDSAMREADDVR